MSLPMRSPANSMEVLLLRLGIALGMLKGDGPGRLLAACGPGNSQKTPSSTMTHKVGALNSLPEAGVVKWHSCSGIMSSEPSQLKRGPSHQLKHVLQISGG